MGDNITISVIIPVYNAEMYLEKAVESIIAQHHDWIEIILVDDGSTDNSNQICDELGKNKNVKVIHKNNGGLSTARNAGLEIATGEYISFLDADDFFDLSLFSKVKKLMLEYDVDLLDFGHKYVSLKDGSYLKVHHKVPKNIVLNREYIHNKIIPPFINICKDEDNFIYSYVWNKIYKRKIIESNKIRFDENRRTWEDRIFVAEYLKYCSTFFSMDEYLYNYVNVENSLSRRYNPDYFRIIVASYYKYKKLYQEEYDFSSNYVNDYWYHSIDNMIMSQLKLYGEKIEVKESIIEILKDPVVVGWFEKYLSKNAFELEIYELLKKQKYESIIILYQKRIRVNTNKQKIISLNNIIRRSIKQLIKRGLMLFGREFHIKEK